MQEVKLGCIDGVVKRVAGDLGDGLVPGARGIIDEQIDVPKALDGFVDHSDGAGFGRLTSALMTRRWHARQSFSSSFMASASGIEAGNCELDAFTREGPRDAKSDSG